MQFQCLGQVVDRIEIVYQSRYHDQCARLGGNAVAVVECWQAPGRREPGRDKVDDPHRRFGCAEQGRQEQKPDRRLRQCPGNGIRHEQANQDRQREGRTEDPHPAQLAPCAQKSDPNACAVAAGGLEVRYPCAGQQEAGPLIVRQFERLAGDVQLAEIRP